MPDLQIRTVDWGRLHFKPRVSEPEYSVWIKFIKIVIT